MARATDLTLPATQERKLAEESGVGVALFLLQQWPLLRAKGQRVYSLNYQSGWQTTPRLWVGLFGVPISPVEIQAKLGSP